MARNCLSVNDFHNKLEISKGKPMGLSKRKKEEERKTIGWILGIVAALAAIVAALVTIYVAFVPKATQPKNIVEVDGAGNTVIQGNNNVVEDSSTVVHSTGTTVINMAQSSIDSTNEKEPLAPLPSRSNTSASEEPTISVDGETVVYCGGEGCDAKADINVSEPSPGQASQEFIPVSSSEQHLHSGQIPQVSIRARKTAVVSNGKDSTATANIGDGSK